MRITITLDDDLFRIAQEFTGIADKTVLLRESLKALVEREVFAQAAYYLAT